MTKLVWDFQVNLESKTTPSSLACSTLWIGWEQVFRDWICGMGLLEVEKMINLVFLRFNESLLALNQAERLSTTCLVLLTAARGSASEIKHVESSA